MSPLRLLGAAAGSAAIIALLVSRVPAQEPIRTQVNEVIVPVTVTDDKGRFVSNLVKSDFRIFDEGREQNISFFSHEQSQPVVIGFLLDQSNAMKIHWTKYQEAATELMLNLLPGDKRYSGYLITYGNEAELIADTNTDSEKMVEKLRKMKPAGARPCSTRFTWPAPAARRSRASLTNPGGSW